MRHILLFFLLTTIAGCATDYQSRGFTGGFTETQLDKNIFKVNFSGNAFTSSEQAGDFALLRAAELTLENGYTHFAVVDANDSVSVGSYTTPSTSTTTLNANAYGNQIYGTANTTTTGGQTYTFRKPKTDMLVIMFEGKPDNQGLILDAQFIQDSLREKHEIAD